MDTYRQATCADYVQANRDVIAQGQSFLAAVDKGIYASVGPHMRHVAGFYTAFFRDISPDGPEDSQILNFSLRDRGSECETDPYEMNKVYATHGLSIHKYQRLDSDTLVNLTIELAPNRFFSQKQTLGGVMHKLWDHAIHHYGLVAALLKVQGFECRDEFFGYHPSSIRNIQQRENSK